MRSTGRRIRLLIVWFLPIYAGASAALSLGCLLCVQSGCSGSSNTAIGSSEPTGLGPIAAQVAGQRLAQGRGESDPVSVLVNRAQAEQPARPSVPPALPALISSARLTPPQSKDARQLAAMPLTEAIARIRSELGRPDDSQKPPAADRTDDTDSAATDAAHREAEMLYLQGREDYLSGQYFEASRRFTQALELDPTSTACMRLLARCSERSAGRAAALKTYERLLELAPRDAEARLKIGQAAMERQEWNEAVSHLATVIGFVPLDPDNSGNAAMMPTQEESEPWVVSLAGIWAGQCLFEMGYDFAGIEAVRLSLQTAIDGAVLNAGGGPLRSTFRTELSELSRMRGNTAQRVGDAWMRLEQPDRAWDWYVQSRALPDAESGEILARMVYVQARLGLPYGAMLTILEALTKPASRDSAVQLVDYVSDFDGNELLGEAIAGMLAEQQDSPAMSLAAASLLSADKGDQILERTFAAAVNQPTSTDAVRRPPVDTMLAFCDWMLRRGENERALAMVIRHAADFDRQESRTLAREFAARIADPAWISADRMIHDVTTQGSRATNLMAMLLMQCDRHQEASRMLATFRSTSDEWSVDLSLSEVEALLGQSLTGEAAQKFAELDSEQLIEDSYRFHTAIELLEHMNRTTSAVELAESAADRCRAQVEATGAGVWDESADRQGHMSLSTILLAQARLEVVRGNVQTAAEILNQITENHPTCEDAYSMLLSLYGPQGELSEPEQFRRLASAIAEHLPESHLFQTLRARNELSRGRTDRGLSLLRRLAEEQIDSRPATELYTIELIRAEQFDQAINWLETQLSKRPGDRSLLDQLITVLVAAHQFEDALGPLKSWLAVHPLDTSAWKSYESILRGLGKEDEARDAARQRLAHLPPSFETACAKAENAIAEKSYDEVFVYLEEAMSRVQADEPPRLERVVQTAARLADEAQRTDDSAVAAQTYDYMIRIVGSWRDRGFTVSSQAHVWRLDAMIRAGWDYDRIMSALTEACRDQPDNELKLYAMAIALLQNSDRTDDACRVIDAWLGTDRAFSPQDSALISLRLMLAATRQEPEFAVLLVKRAAEVNLLDEIEAVTASARTDGSLADSLYVLNGRFLETGDQAGSEYVLEQILVIDPNHPGANNDLGYAWADKGINLDQAERMIMTAYESAPDNVAYIDSLGWLRYKQGRLSDAGAADSELGAITLLTRAAEDDDGRDDPVIVDHLGDALWRAGRKDDAIKAWQNSVGTYQRQLRLAEEYGIESTDMWRQAYEEVTQEAAQKAEDASQGREPRVSDCPGLDRKP